MKIPEASCSKLNWVTQSCCKHCTKQIILHQTFWQQNSPLSWPRMRLYMLRSPNTFRKYHDAELTLQGHNSKWKGFHSILSATVTYQDSYQHLQDPKPAVSWSLDVMNGNRTILIIYYCLSNCTPSSLHRIKLSPLHFTHLSSFLPSIILMPKLNFHNTFSILHCIYFTHFLYVH